jgi:hypothetical protein
MEISINVLYLSSFDSVILIMGEVLFFIPSFICFISRQSEKEDSLFRSLKITMSFQLSMCVVNLWTKLKTYLYY